MQDIAVRAMELADCEAVSRVVCDSFQWAANHESFLAEEIEIYSAGRGSPQAIREQFRTYRCWVACESNRIVGMAAVKGNEITKLYVEPSPRNRPSAVSRG